MKHDDRKLSQIQITLFPSKLPAIKRKKWDLNYIIYQKQINVWLYYSIAQLYNLVNGSGLEPIANKSFQICCLKVQREALSYRKKPCVSNFQNQKIYNHSLIKIKDSCLQVTFVCIYILMYNVRIGSSSGITRTNCVYSCSSYNHTLQFQVKYFDQFLFSQVEQCQICTKTCQLAQFTIIFCNFNINRFLTNMVQRLVTSGLCFKGYRFNSCFVHFSQIKIIIIYLLTTHTYLIDQVYQHLNFELNQLNNSK
ncbi:Hypothetical_protein [Hexamita inflata]|uniref:Hypothetical_protein n=1 Tax=Hexamita inflata TaxID=28002 RepID=A0AA86PRK7_9EUKA|nr:Hypothetical protein HINF_LOCUS31213 [Hexamita inflata]